MPADEATVKAQQSDVAARTTSDALTSPEPGGCRASAPPPSTPSGEASGSSTAGSCASCDRLESSLRTFLGSRIREIAPGSSPTWKRKATPAGHAYWELESSKPRTKGKGHGSPAEIGKPPYSSTVTTPTSTAILVKDWSPEDFILLPSGRWRKRTKSGVNGSMNWLQEMAVRAVVQRNPKLIPTPELCERFMAIPTGWTDIGDAGTALSSSALRSSGASSPGLGEVPEFKDGIMGENLCAQGMRGPQARQETEETEYAERLLADAISAMDGNEKMATSELVQRLRSLPNSTWRAYRGSGITNDASGAMLLASLLKRFGVGPRTIRVRPKGEPNSTAKGYRLADLVAGAERAGLPLGGRKGRNPVTRPVNQNRNPRVTGLRLPGPVL